MKDKGAVLLIVVLAILIVGMAAAALLMVRPADGAGAATTAAGSGPTFSVALARTSTGLTATLTVSNTGSKDLRDLRIIRADIASQVGGKPMPIVIGTLGPGVAIVVTLPYTGPAPAAKAPVQLNFQYDFKTGLFTNGAGSQSLTAILP